MEELASCRLMACCPTGQHHTLLLDCCARHDRLPIIATATAGAVRLPVQPGATAAAIAPEQQQWYRAAARCWLQHAQKASPAAAAPQVSVFPLPAWTNVSYHQGIFSMSGELEREDWEPHGSGAMVVQPSECPRACNDRGMCAKFNDTVDGNVVFFHQCWCIYVSCAGPLARGLL